MHTRTPGHDVAEELRASVSSFVRAVRACVDEVPPLRAETLRALREDGPQTMAALAAARGTSHQNISRVIGEMEELGLVGRTRNPSDGRGFLVGITEAGRELIDTEEQARRTAIDAAITGALTPDEQAALARVPHLLDRLCQALPGRA
ncbi:hypothetical protein SRB5_07190 [Streptomyces sp. RB5]|uniref:HTH marR-type domain-containing protein n=1 Tax=Streptomyces smaragdinus TaxID=2585196 RepID=A0A7K0CB15_9ACTN|nr:MarR family transcriptional regulator [Streptomyces smaragdinus]MQY10608.1 hypothetical protein [Streptomyces smaragdinus]